MENMENIFAFSHVRAHLRRVGVFSMITCVTLTCYILQLV